MHTDTTPDDPRACVKPSPPEWATRWFSACAIAGPLLFTGAWVVLGFLSTGYVLFGTRIAPYSAISQPVSGLGLGVTGPAMTTAFLAGGALRIAGAYGVMSAIPSLEGHHRWRGLVLLALPGLGSIIDGVFTLEAMLPHLGGFLLVLTPVVGFPVLGLTLRSVRGWRRLGTGLVWAGPLTLALAALFFATFDPAASGQGAGLAGLTQRALLVEIDAWYVALGWAAVRRTL